MQTRVSFSLKHLKKYTRWYVDKDKDKDNSSKKSENDTISKQWIGIELRLIQTWSSNHFIQILALKSKTKIERTMFNNNEGGKC